MTDERLTDSDYAVSILEIFPIRIRGSVISDTEFRGRYGLAADAIIRLDDGTKFQRSLLFGALRELYGGVSEREVKSQDGAVWSVVLSSLKETAELKQGERKRRLSDFRCLSPDKSVRMKWFDEERKRFDLNDARATKWSEVLEARPAEDDEVEEILTDIRLTPRYVSETIADHLKGEELDLRVLVPTDGRYYDRLVGDAAVDSDLKSFTANTHRRFTAWIEENAFDGLRRVLLMSSCLGAVQCLDLTKIDRAELLRLYEWVSQRGDLVSQLGAVESALAHIDELPELQLLVTSIVRGFLKLAPPEPDGRLSLLSGLIVMVDGELARTGAAKGRPPFWRRIASIAHASVLERRIIATGAPPAVFPQKWARNVRGRHYYLQTFVDMRREPRWLPDFVLPDQLLAEFMGRVLAAATAHAGKLQDGELKTLLLNEGAGGVQALAPFPFAYLPGPIEGATEALVDMPAEVDADLRGRLKAEPLTPASFASLVNSALIFKVGPQLAQLAVDAIRRAKHQLRQVKSADQVFSLLSGLATVAAVTRSSDLASEVRILVRVERRRAVPGITVDNAIRIALIAAAAHSDRRKGCDFVGDWVTELSFEEMTKGDCAELLAEVQTLCVLEPHLWPTVARADAALTAFSQSSVA
jgi:hypothetical protein